ncbi:VWA domain-containing protein [Candidatus Micrarchaeota archaeon]|nr:VWA domain-containing protein [Candidatus Micrarchaeota archaeon]
MDALFAVMVVLTGVFILYLLNLETVSQEQVQQQLSSQAEDVAELMTRLRIRDVRNDDVVNYYFTTKLDLQGKEDSNGLFYLDDTYLDKTLLEVIGEFWANNSAGKLAAAKNISRDLFGNMVSPGMGWAVKMNEDGAEDIIYSTYSTGPSMGVPEGVMTVVSRRIASGYKKSAPVTGCISDAYLENIKGKWDSRYVFFGGFVGQGNLTMAMRDLPHDQGIQVKELYIEGNVGDNFTLSVNNALCGGGFGRTPYDQDLEGDDVNWWSVKTIDCDKPCFKDERCIQRISDSAKNDQPVVFGINFTGVNITNKSVAGGFIKVNFTTSEMAPRSFNSTRYYFPGVDGVINLYDSFYVPGNVSGVDVHLKLNSSYRVNLTVANVTVESTTPGIMDVQVIDLTNDTFWARGFVNNYSWLSSKTFPVRAVLEANIEGWGTGDVILITDLSASMDAMVSEEKYGSFKITDCNDPAQLARPDAQRLSLAKCLDKLFVQKILSHPGNRVGLVGFSTYAQPSYEYNWDIFPLPGWMKVLTDNQTFLNKTIEGYTYQAYTCLSCAIEAARDVLLEESAPERKKFIVVMSDGIATHRSNKTWFYDECHKDADLIQNVLRGVALNYTPDLSTKVGFAVGYQGRWRWSYDADPWSAGNDLWKSDGNSWHWLPGKHRSLIYKWDGSTWVNDPTIPSNRLNGYSFHDVALFNASFGFIASSGGVVLQWNGVQWSDSPSNIGPSTSSLIGDDLYHIAFVNSSLAFAVAYSGRILEWNGVSWRKLINPENPVDGSGASGALYSIAFSSYDNVGQTKYRGFAVGSGGLILRWDDLNSDGKNEWTIEDASWQQAGAGCLSKPVTSSQYSLSDVAFKDKDTAYIVGQFSVSLIPEMAGGTTSAVSLNWTSARNSWVKELPDFCDNSRNIYTPFSGVAFNGTDGFVAGGWGGLWWRDENKWSRTSSSMTDKTYITFDGRSGIGLTVGIYESIYRWTSGGANWTNNWVADKSTSFAQNSMAFNVTDDGKYIGFSVGDSGKIYNWSSDIPESKWYERWTETDSVTINHLRGIAFLSNKAAYAVGYGATILKWDGVTWNVFSSPNPKNYNLTAIAFGSPEIGFAVGEKGKIIKWDKNKWENDPQSGTVTTKNLTGVAFARPDLAFAVGKQGAFLKWDGSVWSSIADPASAIDFYAISIAPGFGLAVGAKGTVFKWDDTNWQDITSISPNATLDITAVAVSNPQLAVIAYYEYYHPFPPLWIWNGTGWNVSTVWNIDFRRLNGLAFANSSLAFGAGTGPWELSGRGLIERWDPWFRIYNGTDAYSWNVGSSHYTCEGNPLYDCNTLDCYCAGDSAAASAERAHDDIRVNATIFSIGFGPVEQCYIGNLTLNHTAAEGNGSYYHSTKPEELQKIYTQIAEQILIMIEATQEARVIGQINTTLYSDSYIQFNFTPETIPFGKREIVVSGERGPFSTCQGNFDLPAKYTVHDARATSYSSKYWTDLVQVAANLGPLKTVFNLADYKISYKLLGDPFVVRFDSATVGTTNEIDIQSHSSEQTNPTKYCSPNNKFIYKARFNATVPFGSVRSTCFGAEVEICSKLPGLPGDPICRFIKFGKGEVLPKFDEDELDDLRTEGANNAMYDAFVKLLYSLNDTVCPTPDDIPGTLACPLPIELPDNVGAGATTFLGVLYTWGPAEMDVIVWPKGTT